MQRLIPQLAFVLALSAHAQTPSLLYGTPGAHITVLENTLIRVRSDQPLSTRHSKEGTPVTFQVSQDVIVHRVLAIPRGATIHGEVMRSKKSGVLSGTPELTLQLESLELGGTTYPLYTYQLSVRGATKTRPTFRQVEGAAVVGAIAGAIVRNTSDTPTTRSNDAADVGGGAAIGAGAVETTAILTPKPIVRIPAESEMDFYLASPVSVHPVTKDEAERLSQRVKSTDPVLYIRGDTP